MSESIDIRELNARIEQQSAFVTNITAGMSHVIVGQQHLVESLLIGLLSDGHVLLEGVPGLAKTRLVRSLGRVFDLPFSRIQFTPDLMPADVTGTNIIVKDENGNSSFQFQPGPVFSNIVLADEISPDTCRFWDSETNEKLDKDRFRRDMGGVEDAYHEMMKRVFGA